MAHPQQITRRPFSDRHLRLKHGRAGALAVALLLIPAFLVIFRVTASIHAEHILQQASLHELQADARRDSDNPRVFYYLGLRAQQSGQGSLAMSAFWHAANLDPDDERLWLTWSQTAFGVQGRQAARNILMTFIKIHPQNALMHIQLAKLLEQDGDQANAYAVVQRATKLDRTNAEAWQLLGRVALELRDSNRAEMAFRQAIALRPQDSFNHAGLGDALFLMARYPEAAAAYRKAIRLAPEMGTGYMALGQALLKTAITTAEIEAARTCLQQALARPATIQRTGLYTTYLCIGQSYEQQARWKEALPWLKQAAAIQPTYPDTNNHVHFELTRVYRALQDPTDAARELTLHQRSVAYFLQVKTLSSYLSNHPNDTSAGLRLARLYALHHDYADATQAFRAALVHASDKRAVRQEMATVIGHDPDAR